MENMGRHIWRARGAVHHCTVYYRVNDDIMPHINQPSIFGAFTAYKWWNYCCLVEQHFSLLFLGSRPILLSLGGSPM